MNKTSILKIILIAFIIISLGLGGFGYYNSTTNNSKNNTDNAGDKYKITMLYYLNGTQKLTEMPSNPNEEILYKFEKYVCTNKVKGVWDEDKWKFDIEKTADATCKLYFVSAVYNVTFNVINGTLDSNAITKVDSNADGVFKIAPTDGYTYDKTSCTNNEEIFWDEVKNELTVKTIKSDTTCNVEFKLKEYNVEIVVTNGKGAVIKTIPHGQTFASEVTATSGYGDPKITCNNTDLGQIITAGTWTNNTYSMNSITSNTKCVLEFKLVQVIPVKYTLTMQIDPTGTADVESSITVDSGQTVNVTVNPHDGYKIGTVTVCNGTYNGNIVTVSNIQKNTTCIITMVQND